MYTPGEIVVLVQAYQLLHGDQYQDKLINSEYLNPGFDVASNEDYRFYEKNLNYSADGYRAVSGSLTGTTQGYKEAITETAGNYWALANSLTNDFFGTVGSVSSGVANGLVAAVSTDQAWNSYWEKHDTTKVLEALYDFQGDAAASAAVKAKDEAGLMLDAIPANRVGKLAEVAAKVEAQVVKQAVLPAG